MSGPPRPTPYPPALPTDAHVAPTFVLTKLGQRAVWKTGESSSHWGITFDNAAPGGNVVIRPNTTLPGSERPSVWLLSDPILKPAGPRTVAADVGFLGGATANQAKVRLFWYKVDLVDPKPPAAAPLPGSKWVSGAMPMVPLEQTIPADKPGDKPYRLLVGIELQDFVGDAACPLALWGVRIVP